MLFRPALFLALVALTFARPSPSSSKTIASASGGSKSSIKSPSQKLAEKNNSPPSVASIVELPVQNVAQSENLSVNLPQITGQDSDSGLQYSQEVLQSQPSKVVPVVVKESEPVDSKLESAPLASAPSIQNEVVKPSSVHVAVPSVVETVSAPVVQPVVPQAAPIETPVITENKPVVEEIQNVPVQPVVEITPEVKPVVAQYAPVVAEPIIELKPVVVAEQSVPTIIASQSAPVVPEVQSAPIADKPIVETVVQPVVIVQDAPVQTVPVEAPVQPIVETKPIAQPVVAVEPAPTSFASQPVPVVPEVQNAPVVEKQLVENVVHNPVPVVPQVVETPSQSAPVVPVVVAEQNSVKPIESQAAPEVPVVVAEQAVPIVESKQESQPIVPVASGAAEVQPAVSPIATV